jgi:S1-C subfamily serine protease
MRSLMIALTVVGVLANGAARADDALAPERFAKVAAALVDIQARGCPGQRQSQGFLFNAQSDVLTVRHGIAGCSDITVSVFDPNNVSHLATTYKATVKRVLSKADLALLTLALPRDAALPPPLTPDAVPSANTSIFVIARWLEGSGVRDKKLRVANGSRRLSTIVTTPGIRTALARAGSPSLQLDVINLDIGSIIPGTSGAPIVNMAGNVVGIADGGLDKGVGGITWAIPISNFGDLTASPENTTSLPGGDPSAALFSADVRLSEDALSTAVECGTASLVKTRTARLSELIEFSDDPQGLLFVHKTTVGVDPQSATFDIYRDHRTGAAIALPSGTTLSTDDSGCSAGGAEGAIRYAIRVTAVANPLGVESEALAFEGLFGVNFAPWMYLPATSYATPLTRPDGLAARRKNFNKLILGPFGQPVGTSATFFETLATRNKTFLGFGAQFAPEPGISANLAEWGKAVLAVHLATFARN